MSSASGAATRSSPSYLAGLGLVVAGGALGSLLRYLAAAATPGPPGIEVLTIFVINVLGSFLLGLLVGGLRRPGAHSAGTLSGARRRLFWGTGVLGGFTTYSTYALQTVTAAGDGAWRLAAVYAGLSVVLGVAAARWGLRLGRRPGARR